MVVVERRGKLLECRQEVGGGVAVVMKVHFNVGDSGVRQARNAVDDLAIILFGRIEEGVLRSTAKAVAHFRGNQWPMVRPAVDPFERNRVRYATATRLEMVGEHEPDRCGGCGRRSPVPIAPPTLYQAGTPELRVSREVHCHGRSSRR